MKYRVGRKQKRALLDDKGCEVGLFKKGKEDLAKNVCELLNQDQTCVVKQRELLKDFLDHIESVVDYLQCEPSVLIDDYFLEKNSK